MREHSNSPEGTPDAQSRFSVVWRFRANTSHPAVFNISSTNDAHHHF